MSQAITPPLVVVPASSLTLYEEKATILNDHNEGAVDISLGTDNAVTLVALLRPGIAVGEELVLRVIRRAARIVNSVDVSNKASLSIKTMVPGSLSIEQDYLGFGDATQFTFPPMANVALNFGPAFAVFRWNGVAWLPVFKRVPPAA